MRMINNVSNSIRARIQAAAGRVAARTEESTGKTTGARANRPSVPAPANLPGFTEAASAYRAKFDADRLKAKLEVDAGQVKDRGTRFQESNFGRSVTGGGGSQLDALKGAESVRSRNPIDQQGLGMVTGRNGMLSDDPAAEKGDEGGSRSWTDAISDFASNAFGAIVGKLEFPAFPAWSFLSGPGSTGTEDGPANIGEAVKGFGRLGRGEYYHEGMKDVDDGTKEPLPDDTAGSGPPRLVTKGDLKGIQARLDAAKESTGEEGSSGGAINTGANGAGKTGSLIIPATEVAGRAAVTAVDIKGIEARIQSRINIVR